MSTLSRFTSVIMQIDRHYVADVVGTTNEQQLFNEHGNDVDCYVYEVLKSVFVKDENTGAKCAKCDKFAVVIQLKQTRSADEGMTAIGHCTNCGHKWRC